MKLSHLTPELIRLMHKDDKKALGRIAMTPEEAMEGYVSKSEKQLQEQLSNLLRLRGIWFDRDSMAHRRKGTLGAADFQFPLHGHWISWEVKFGANDLDPEQVKARDAIVAQGGIWKTIRSVAEAIAHLAELDAA